MTRNFALTYQHPFVVIRRLFLFLGISFFCVNGTLSAQSTTRKSPPIEILNSNVYKFKKLSPTSTLKILSGNVKIKQGAKTWINCDSMNEYSKPHVMYMYGKVKVKYGKDLSVHSDYMEYYPDEEKAFFTGDVTLFREKSKLKTTKATYEKNKDLFIYDEPGKLVDGEMTLTSNRGTYNGTTKLSSFYENVHLVDSVHDLKADSLRYDGTKSILHLIAPSVIKDVATGRTLIASAGYLSNNKKKGKNDRTFLTKRPQIFDTSFFSTADTIISYGDSSVSYLIGRAQIYDSVNQTLIKADSMVVNNKTSSFFAYKNPLMYFYKNPENPFVLRADFIFSSKYVESPEQANHFTPMWFDQATSLSSPSAPPPPTTTTNFGAGQRTIRLGDVAKNSTPERPMDADTLDTPMQPLDMVSSTAKDTATSQGATTPSAPSAQRSRQQGFLPSDRFFNAYYNVKMYSDSIQLSCDSLYYSSVDSVARMMDEPILWFNDNEIKGKMIYAHLKNKAIDRILVSEKSFVLSQEFDSLYTQARAKYLTYYVSPDTKHDSIVLEKNSEMIYFVKDSLGYYISFDRTSADKTTVYLNEKRQMSTTRFLGNYQGEHYPPKSIPVEKLYLPDFKTMAKRRPSSIEYIETYQDSLVLYKQKQKKRKNAAQGKSKKSTTVDPPRPPSISP